MKHMFSAHNTPGVLTSYGLMVRCGLMIRTILVKIGENWALTLQMSNSAVRHSLDHTQLTNFAVETVAEVNQ